MKIRNGFVSNSSSSSFILALAKIKDIPSIVRKITKINEVIKEMEDCGCCLIDIKTFNSFEDPFYPGSSYDKNKIYITDGDYGADVSMNDFEEFAQNYNSEQYVEFSKEAGQTWRPGTEKECFFGSEEDNHEVKKLITEFKDYICKETLSDDINFVD